eukprot:CAMPEP_0175093724 /NCGR_PEP_ID=MMETSP0086_2-20121207/3182_1 /TAXON_ID=136419 /ORGANISM="Unknown Unknown, Strain D1" /LENGTH=186 /DNA_ID=CAMNT_0016366739 /DNA_START=124 /DNA_END=684 /DNA_ORIENTATION=-
MVFNPNYGLHVFARGKNASLYHKWQTGPVNSSSGIDNAPMSDWHCLTPNASLTFDTDPTAALNANGQIEIFVRMSTFIDLWQIYQADPKNPDSFLPAREGTCMCPFVSPDDCPWCLDCESRPECSKAYFCDHAPFPTSAATVLMGDDKKLKVMYRGFDGRMYALTQKVAGDPSKYTSGITYDSVFE